MRSPILNEHGDPIFVVTTQPTAAWLLAKSIVRTAIASMLADNSLVSTMFSATGTVQFAEGALRVVADGPNRLIAIVNVDYVTSPSIDGIGLINVGATSGLLKVPEFIEQVFERELFVINQRLRNLIFESKYFHQAFENGGHKVLAGRGTDPRDYSIGYVERLITLGNATVKAVFCVGPEKIWQKASAAAITDASEIGDRLQTALSLLSGRFGVTNVLPRSTFLNLRNAVIPLDAKQLQTPIASITRRQATPIDDAQRYATSGWTYDQWIAADSPLTDEQRQVFEQDAILTHPLRVIGAAGSGKTLLMQLLAMRRLHQAKADGQAIRIAYLTHNEAMRQTAYERFHVLGAAHWLRAEDLQLSVTTLATFSSNVLQLDQGDVFERDAGASKHAQLDLVYDALVYAVQKNPDTTASSSVLSVIAANPRSFLEYVRAEFSISIKSQGMYNDRARYIGSDRPLAKLHGLLNPEERSVIYDAFLCYEAKVDELDSYDPDDVAISLLGEMRIPTWRKRRRLLGFDFIFVDEAQLFNENEQRIFPYLAKSTSSHVPLVLALDEAQQFYAEPTVGLGALGIEDVDREVLSTVHRMSYPIAQLAFFVISRSTELFNPDFPDFTSVHLSEDNSPEASLPRLEVRRAETLSLGRAVEQCVRQFRRRRYRHIGIVCHADQYWDHLRTYLTQHLEDLDFTILVERGQRLDHKHPYTIMAKSESIGGQEFDGVICVGLENGVVPKRAAGSVGLQEALYQQSLREIYLAFSRARSGLTIINEAGSEPSGILVEAIEDGVLLLPS